MPRHQIKVNHYKVSRHVRERTPMVISDDGDFVHRDDYTALLEEAKNLQAELDRLKLNWTELEDTYKDLQAEANVYDKQVWTDAITMIRTFKERKS